jgi:Domain of unknown function (DUF1840)
LWPLVFDAPVVHTLHHLNRKLPMLYRFKSQATADLVMLGADAQGALRLIGKDLTPEGVISPDQLPRAIDILQICSRTVGGDGRCRARCSVFTATGAAGEHAGGGEQRQCGGCLVRILTARLPSPNETLSR